MSSSSSLNEFVKHQMGLTDVMHDEIRRTLEITQSQWKEMEESFDSMKEGFLAQINDFNMRQHELDAQGWSLEAFKKSWELRLSIIGIKEKTLSLKLDMAGVKFQQLEMKEMRLDERESELERREKLLEENYENSRKKQKRLDSTTHDEDFIHFVICHADDLPSVRDEVKMELKRASNPAKLVLDAIETFNGSDLEGSCELEAAGRSFAMVLVEVLWEVEPEIGVLERERAMKLALEWKEKIKMEDESEVLGFLHLLLSYRLTGACEKGEFLRFIEIVEDRLSAPALKYIFRHFVPNLI